MILCNQRERSAKFSTNVLIVYLYVLSFFDAIEKLPTRGSTLKILHSLNFWPSKIVVRRLSIRVVSFSNRRFLRPPKRCFLSASRVANLGVFTFFSADIYTPCYSDRRTTFIWYFCAASSLFTSLVLFEFLVRSCLPSVFVFISFFL